MNKLLIGSTAIKYWFPDFPREPKDRDYAVQVGEKSTKEVEYLYNPVLFKEVYLGHLIHVGNDYIASPDMLYTLKMSHMFWDINWNKHIFDIQWMKDHGCKPIRSLFFDLYKFWCEYHGGNKRSDLNMSAEDFFNNAIKFPVKHDDLHELLVQHEYFKGQERPTYVKVLKDDSDVDVSEEKFNLLTYKEKFNLLFEEIACMGVERFPKHWYYKEIFSVMLKKFIISHCKLFQAIWILDNYNYIMSNIPFNFRDYLHNKVYGEI